MSAGTQYVGPAMCARSDRSRATASHFYENMEKVSPFPIVFDIGAMLQGYRTVQQLAASPEHLIPGHDPQVIDRYPPPEPRLAGTIVRLDASPRRRALLDAMIVEARRRGAAHLGGQL
jgi:hypothetical protein